MGSDNKTCKPLNLFFSYGHKKEEQFITCKIFHAVKDRGHHIWRDTEKITFSSSWRQKIENGVLHSNGVIGCLSAYSCRPGGVCLDELSIAVGVRGGRRVYSILLDKEGDVNPPQSVADRQWLDMSAWREKRAQGSAVFEPWFAARMQELFAVIESPENVEFVGQITTIRQRLTVYYGTAKQNKLLQNPFIGRAWLTQRVDAWLDDKNAPRTLFLTGAPAVGKSAWACHYAQYNGRVAAALFLDSDCDYFNDPRTVIQTLAFLLACRLPEYREILMEFLPDSRKETARMNEQELFSCLLAEPFQHIVDGAHRHMAIVIDGLDEAGHETNALAKVLFRYASQLPNWIRFLLCGRDVPALKPFTETALRVELPSGSAENLADMRAFFCFRLEKTFGSDPQWGEALERMTARSEGIAMYAQLLCDMLLDKKTLDCEEFPKGLTGMFTVWFEHYIPDVEEFRRFFRPAICCILGMPGQALPIATLRRVMGWRAAQTNDFLLRLQVLLRRKNDVYGEETVTFDHAFVREWLGSEAAGRFYCPPEDGRELLAEGIYAAFEKDAEGLTCWEAETLADFRNMLSQTQREKVEDSYAFEVVLLRAAKHNLPLYGQAHAIAASRCTRNESENNLRHLLEILNKETIITLATKELRENYPLLLSEKCDVYKKLEPLVTGDEKETIRKHWIRHYIQIGNYLAHSGKLFDGHRILEQSCKELEEKEIYPKELLIAYDAFLYCLRKENKHRKAWKTCKNACALAKKTQDMYYISEFYTEMGAILLDLDHPEMIPNYLQEGAEKMESVYKNATRNKSDSDRFMPYLREASKACKDLGDMFYEASNTPQAINAYQISVKIREPMKKERDNDELNDSLLISCLKPDGPNVTDDLSDWYQKFKTYKKWLEDYTQKGYTISQRNIMNRLERHCKRLGNYPREKLEAHIFYMRVVGDMLQDIPGEKERCYQEAEELLKCYNDGK